MSISPADIEAKARQLQEALEETKAAAQNTAMLAGVAVVMVLVVAYWLGRRRGGRSRATIEVYRT